MAKQASNPLRPIGDRVDNMIFMRIIAAPYEVCPCGNRAAGYWCYGGVGTTIHEHFYTCEGCMERWRALGPLMALTIGGD